MRYTVVRHKGAHDELAKIWLASGVALAANTIDAQLATDAHRKGIPAAAGLQQLTVAPLSVVYSVDQTDRLVHVLNVFVV